MNKRITKLASLVVEVLVNASIIAVFAAICALSVKFLIWVII